MEFVKIRTLFFGRKRFRVLKWFFNDALDANHAPTGRNTKKTRFCSRAANIENQVSSFEYLLSTVASAKAESSSIEPLSKVPYTPYTNIYVKIETGKFLQLFDKNCKFLITFGKFLEIFGKFLSVFSPPSFRINRISYPYYHIIGDFPPKTIKLGNLRKIGGGFLRQNSKKM